MGLSPNGANASICHPEPVEGSSFLAKFEQLKILRQAQNDIRRQSL